MPEEAVSWSRFFEKRREIHRRWRSIWEVPLLRKRARLILPLARPGLRVLDIGGGEQEWRERLKQAVPDLVYACVEPDPARPGHAATLAETGGGDFHLALMLEVIEHLEIAEGLQILRDVYKRLAPGGRIVLSTPNIFHPSRFLEDATHRTPYSYECLGGALLTAEFSVESLHRSYNASVIERPFRWLLTPLHRALGIDYAKSIFAVGKKK